MICDSEVVDIGQFRIFRRDRSSSTSLKWDGRGAFVAVRRDLRPSLVPEFQSNAEDVWIQISVGGQRVFMCCVYIPSGDAAAIPSFSSKICTMRDKIMKDIVVIGSDLNLSSVLWEYNSSQMFFELITVKGKYFDLIDALSLLELMQFDNIKNSNNKVSGLIFSNAFKIDNIIKSSTHWYQTKNITLL